MNLPNKLTILRVLLAPLFLLLLLWDFPFHYLAAALTFGAAALTDLFDGRIARRRGLVTNFGKFLDPLADKMLTTAAFIGFLAQGHMDAWALMLILSREFMVTSVRLLAAKGGKVVAASMSGKLKTVMQFVAILYMLAALEFCSWRTGLLSAVALPDALFTGLLIFGRVLIWIAAVMTVISGFQYVWDCREFLKEGK